jgi:hypothetical protein
MQPILKTPVCCAGFRVGYIGSQREPGTRAAEWGFLYPVNGGSIVSDNQLWRDEKHFFAASDDQRSQWLERCKALDIQSIEKLKLRKAKREEILTMISEVWDYDPHDARRIRKYVANQKILSGGGYVSRHERLMYRMKQERENQEKEQKARQHKREMEELKRKELRDLIAIAIRYNFDHQLSADDILAKLCETNPYLNLAMAMFLTRCDWSEGFYRVESALTEFETAIPHDQRTENDHAIIAAQRERLYTDDNYRDTDGRIFRDGEWSYDDIFQLVDKQLVEDAMKLYEIMD